MWPVTAKLTLIEKQAQGCQMNARSNDPQWGDYLDAFHGERPGITEAILDATSAEDGADPYDWLADALPDHGTIIDVACGSGPLATRAGSHWIGLDRNASELDLASQAAPGRVVLADVAAVPLRADAADAVACSMALMVFSDPASAMAHVARLLRPGGVFAALVPAYAPLTVRDRLRYGRLLAALRLPRLPFPQDRVLRNPRPLLAPAGLSLVSSERRRFAYPIRRPDDADRWLRSLYLPSLGPRRLHAARQVARRWTGSDVGIPLRRLVATKNP